MKRREVLFFFYISIVHILWAFVLFPMVFHGARILSAGLNEFDSEPCLSAISTSVPGHILTTASAPCSLVQQKQNEHQTVGDGGQKEKVSKSRKTMRQHDCLHPMHDDASHRCSPGPPPDSGNGLEKSFIEHQKSPGILKP